MPQARSTSPTPKRLRRWLLVGLAASLAAGLALAGLLAQPATTSGDLHSFTEQLDRDEARWLAAADIHGASVALVRNGEMVWSNGYGQADAARGIPVTADTIFHMASISKSVTAWGVLRLVEQGRLDLDAPVETYLSRWHLPASPFDSDGVTIGRLLSHSAGLSTQDYTYLPRTVRPLPSLEESLAGDSGGANARSRPDDVHISMEPGQQFNYSNVPTPGTTQTSVDKIAKTCGFGTPETMNRTFRRRLNTTPGNHRQHFGALSYEPEPRPATRR